MVWSYTVGTLKGTVSPVIRSHFRLYKIYLLLSVGDGGTAQFYIMSVIAIRQLEESNTAIAIPQLLTAICNSAIAIFSAVRR